MSSTIEEYSDNLSEVNSEIPHWSDADDVKLMYALFEHKPVGINKHFHMIEIVNNFNDLQKSESLASVSSDVLWQRLKELYNLQLLEEYEKFPQKFPSEAFDFENLIQQNEWFKRKSIDEFDEDKCLAKILMRSESEESKMSGTDIEDSYKPKNKRKKISGKFEGNVSSEEEPAAKTLRSRGRHSLVKKSESPLTTKKKK